MQARLEDAWERVSSAASEAVPQLRALAQRASAMAGPTAERGRLLIEHLRTAENETLAVYYAAAGMVALYLSSRWQGSSPPPRRRLFLGAGGIRSTEQSAASLLAERGLDAGKQVLIAARSMEAVEMWQFCSLLRADAYLIDGSDPGSAVAFSLRVRPHWFVYDSEVIALDTVHSIAKALKDNGCACFMLAVAEKAAPAHVLYSAVLGSAMPGSRVASPNVKGLPPQRNVSPAFVPVESSPSGGNGSFRLFTDSNVSSQLRGKSYVPDPLYATSYPDPPPSSQNMTSTAAGGTTRDSDIFTEFGTAVVGLFGAPPPASHPRSTQSISLQRALDYQLNEEVGNRSSRRSDGQPLIAL